MTTTTTPTAATLSMNHPVPPIVPLVGDDPAMRNWADELVARVRNEGVALTGDDGLLTAPVRQVLQTGLEVEMTDHLGYEPHAVDGRGSGNSRNGSYPKTVTTEIGQAVRPPGLHVPPAPIAPRPQVGRLSTLSELIEKFQGGRWQRSPAPVGRVAGEEHDPTLGKHWPDPKRFGRVPLRPLLTLRTGQNSSGQSGEAWPVREVG